MGPMLYSPAAINDRLKDLFRESGWEESITNFYLTDDMELIRGRCLTGNRRASEDVEW